ncbi:hypothetical protein MFMK1_001947 [Metallumcola ferriviriculae]|uniref:RNA polymerase sigma factor 70 region 4 type 2 domain-containing protein n=1 Tax=Metallumcola ferriviriculae TaxID=3039180 RepID=A0AAU0US95_9FIRM|nr:hypothetical protein MFMK1_001947 [Desulfitibacteraceae bacterium MK1]
MSNEIFIRQLYTLCYRLTGDVQLTQDLCLRTVEKLQRDKLFSSAEGIFVRAAEAAVELLLEQRCSNLSRAIAPDDSIPEIQQALNGLPVKERAVIVLKDIYRLTYPEIERIVQGEEVSYLAHQGRQKLTRIIIDAP